MAADPRADAPARPRLAIAIPAFGRADAIAASIAAMADEARTAGLSVAFHVSDDTPDTSVEDALRLLAAAGHPVHYRRNTPALGHDRNLVATLLWPDADYVWLLGSSHRIAPGRLAPVAGFLADQDLVFVNANAPEQPDVAAVGGAAAHALLRDLLWHHTLTGATLYGARARDWARGQGGALRVFPNFPQVSVILGFAAARDDATLGWLGGRNLAYSGSTTASYWRARPLEVFGTDWAAAIAGFPAVIPMREVARVVRAHSERLDLFNTDYLTTLRAEGRFRWSSLRQPGVRQAMHLPLWKLVAVLALPVPLLRTGGTALARLKRRRAESGPGA